MNARLAANCLITLPSRYDPEVPFAVVSRCRRRKTIAVRFSR